MKKTSKVFDRIDLVLMQVQSACTIVIDDYRQPQPGADGLLNIVVLIIGY